MIATFSKFFRLLSSDIEPYQLSLGLCFGLVAGISPTLTVQSVMVIFLIIILRANVSMFLLSYAAVSLIAYLADPVIIAVGKSVLELSSLNELFTQMYNSGLWRFLNFNNTAAMGSLIIAAVAILPVYIISLILIKRYRTVIEQHWKNSRLFKFISKSKWLGKVAAISDRVS